MGSTPYSEQWPAFQNRQRQQMESALEDFLLDEGRYDCFTSLSYLLEELAGNADKANLKGAHFDVLGLDQSDPAQYAAGMARFKESIAADEPALAEALRRRKAHLRIQFERVGDDLVFVVFNNAPFFPIVKDRFQKKLRLAREFSTIQEVLASELDQSEGGGLGLIMSVLMLRKLGLTDQCLTMGGDAHGTEVRLVIPPQAESIVEGLAKDVVEAIDHIPQFPDHVIEILRILEDPAKSFDDISPIVRKDPNLIAGLLKAANSSMYNLSRRIDTIEEAVRVLGLGAIQDLLVAATAERLLIQDFHLPAIKSLMEHAVEVAWYCRELAKAAHLGKQAGTLFLAAMLHDFGEILVNSLIPGLTETIGALCLARGWNAFRTESLTNGFNHSLAGAQLARKWNFPHAVVEAIEYHHIPFEASRSSQNAVCLVYLGDFLWSRARGLVTWDDLLPGVVERFPAKTPEEWEQTLEGILAKRKAH